MKLPFKSTDRLMAFQWNENSVDYVLARRIQDVTIVEATGTVHASEDSQAIDVSGVLEHEVQRVRAPRPRIFVAVSRRQVDVHELELPPSADDELPKLVTHQLMRESSELAETANIDFVPLDEDNGQPRRVCAVVADHAVLDNLRDICSQAGLVVRRIVYQPTASVGLLRRMMSTAHDPAYVVSLRDDEAHVLTCADWNLRHIRSFVLPVDGRDQEQLAYQLCAEIRRCQAIAVNEEDNGTTPQVYLFGCPRDRADLALRMSDDLAINVSILDPFDTVELRNCSRPPDVGRFASLLGIIHREYDRSQTLDLLHPRQAPKPPSVGRRLIACASAAMILLTVTGFYVYDQRSSAHTEIVTRKQALTKLDARLANISERTSLVAAVQQWQANDVVWLDQLHELTERFPDAHHARVRKMSMAATTEGGAIDMQLQVRNPTTISELEQRVRDPLYQVSSKRISESPEGNDFPWRFQTTIIVLRPSVDETKDAFPENEAISAENFRLPRPDHFRGDGRDLLVPVFRGRDRQGLVYGFVQDNH